MVDNFFRTSLYHVSGAPHESQQDGVRVAQLLLENGADVNTRDINRESPLHLAASFGKLEMARLFLNHATVQNIRGENPSHLGLEGDYCIQINIFLSNTFPSARRGCECPQERSLDSVTSCLSLWENRGCTVTSQSWRKCKRGGQLPQDLPSSSGSRPMHSRTKCCPAFRAFTGARRRRKCARLIS
jgi:hypothetical protein